MRLAWIILAALVAVSVADKWSSSTDATSTTAVDVDVKTTTDSSGDHNTASTTPKTENTIGSTVSPGDTTDAPVTDAPGGETDDGTDNTKAPVKTTAKGADTTVTTTTKKAVSTTTKEPQPDVESFSVLCNKTSSFCTYTMQVPGLDIDTYNRLMQETNDTGTEVESYESTDLVNLQAGVTKVFDDAMATVDYIQSQLDSISDEINYLTVQATQLESDINDVNTAVATANNYLNKILNKKGSCLYRQCVLKEPTTTRPVTTTTTKPAPVKYCDVNPNPCENGGSCVDWYGSYYCTCIGNLDGQDFNCAASVCDVVKQSQDPGLIVSPGYYAKNDTNTAWEDCDTAQWTVKAAKPGSNMLNLVEKEQEFKDKRCILDLSPDSNLQLTVGKYKLKITSKTKYSQITQILAYGPTATISYSGPAGSDFHFTIKEDIAPITPATPKK